MKMSKIATKGKNAYNWYFNKLRNVGGSVGEIFITITTTIATIIMMMMISLHEKQTVLSNHTFHKSALKTKCVEQFLNWTPKEL